MIESRRTATLCGVVILVLLVGSPAWGEDLVPYQASGWRFMQVPREDPLSYEFWQLDFDDSAWPIGQGAFGNGHPLCALSSTVHTHWDADTEMLLRRQFTADPYHPVTVHFAIDNDAEIYVNEVLIASVIHEFCPELDEFNVIVPGSVIVFGENTLAVRAIDRGGVSFVDVRVEGEPGAIPVFIDIRPGSCPNPINMRMRGEKAVIPVAILGTPDVAVKDIDPATITLEGVPARRWALEDVSTPLPRDRDECECTTEGPDGFLDLVMHFDYRAIVNALGEQQNGTLVPASVNGHMIDGEFVTGSDCFLIRHGVPVISQARIRY
ncbi:MAG: hypothetical protein AB1Z65_00095 [Candidatus Sulfomarinibacteraceae bacterium]